MSKQQPASPFDVLGLRKKGRVVPKRIEENHALRKIMGDRFESARKLNLWSQDEAAERLDYANATQLSLVERGKRPVPLAILLRASTVYGVSVDYLMGVSDEPERDPKVAERQAAMRHVGDVMNQAATVIVTQIQCYLTAGAPSVLATRAFLTRADEAIAAVERLRELNKDAFEGDMKGAASVLRTIDALAQAVLNAKALLERHDRMAETAISTAERRLGISHPLFDQMG